MGLKSVLHGAPVECDVGIEWYAVDELEPISSHIGQQCIQMESNIPTHLIEIDSIASDSVYTHVTVNDEICSAKLDTGAQINVKTESLFKCIGKIIKLLLYPK